MALSPTRFSRVSVGWVSSTQSIVDVDAADTGDTFSITGNGSVSGTWSVGGGSAVAALRTATASLDFGSVGAQGKSVLTMGITGATAGDNFIVTPGSTYSGNYEWLTFTAYASAVTTGEVNVLASNLSSAAINPDAITFRLTRLAF